MKTPESATDNNVGSKAPENVPETNVGKINGMTPDEIKKGMTCCLTRWEGDYLASWHPTARIEAKGYGAGMY